MAPQKVILAVGEFTGPEATAKTLVTALNDANKNLNAHSRVETPLTVVAGGIGKGYIIGTSKITSGITILRALQTGEELTKTFCKTYEKPGQWSLRIAPLSSGYGWMLTENSKQVYLTLTLSQIIFMKDQESLEAVGTVETLSSYAVKKIWSGLPYIKLNPLRAYVWSENKDAWRMMHHVKGFNLTPERINRRLSYADGRDIYTFNIQRGEIMMFYMNAGGVLALEFATGDAAKSALSLLTSHPAPSANPSIHPQVTTNPASNVVKVENLPPDASEDELRQLFNRCPGYRRLCLGDADCFVEFDDVQCATRTLISLHDKMLPNSTNGGIRLSYSKPTTLPPKTSTTPSPSTASDLPSPQPLHTTAKAASFDTGAAAANAGREIGDGGNGTTGAGSDSPDTAAATGAKSACGLDEYAKYKKYGVAWGRVVAEIDAGGDALIRNLMKRSEMVDSDAYESDIESPKSSTTSTHHKKGPQRRGFAFRTGGPPRHSHMPTTHNNTTTTPSLGVANVGPTRIQKARRAVATGVRQVVVYSAVAGVSAVATGVGVLNLGTVTGWW